MHLLVWHQSILSPPPRPSPDPCPPSLSPSASVLTVLHRDQNRALPASLSLPELESRQRDNLKGRTCRAGPGCLGGCKTMLKAVRSLRKARYNPPSFSFSLSQSPSPSAKPPPRISDDCAPPVHGSKEPTGLQQSRPRTRDAAPHHTLSCHGASLSHCGRGPENLPAGCCGG